MKRILAVAVALLVLGVASVSSAAPRQVTRMLYKHASLALYPCGATAMPGGGGTPCDSAWFSHNTAWTDTTASFTVPDRWWAPVVISADSLSLFDVFIAPDVSRNSAVGTTAACDTLHLILQGSFNNKDWVSGPTVGVQEAGSSDQVSRAYTTTRFGGAPATATNATMGFYPFFRFIVVSSDATGAFNIGIRYWQDNVTNP